MSKKFWTKENDEFLIKNYLLKKSKFCSMALGISDKAVRTRACRLKITKKNDYISNGYPWDDNKIIFLKENYSILGREECAKKLGCSAGTIQNMLSRLKIKFWQEKSGEKTCSCCKQSKPISDYSPNKLGRFGVASRCKSCQVKIMYKRKKENKNEWLLHCLRNRINLAVKNNSKSKRTIELLGCSIPEFKIYLENQFSDGMTWDNYGKWHIDHIRPCASFNLADEKQQLECFNYRNLQPLWAKDNLSKSDKLNWKGEV